jgi:hypothetical protein
MSVCTKFGEYNSSKQHCNSCKVIMSCKREKIRIYNSTRKEKVVRRNLTNVTKNKFQGIGSLGRFKTRLLRSLSFCYRPISTSEIYNEVDKWGQEKVSNSKLLEVLKELSDMGYLIKMMKSNCYFWITLSNNERIRNS